MQLNLVIFNQSWDPKFSISTQENPLKSKLNQEIQYKNPIHVYEDRKTKLKEVNFPMWTKLDQQLSKIEYIKHANHDQSKAPIEFNEDQSDLTFLTPTTGGFTGGRGCLSLLSSFSCCSFTRTLLGWKNCYWCQCLN